MYGLSCERVFLAPMEKEICNEGMVKNCVIIGDDRGTVAVLVERHHDKAIEHSTEEMTSKGIIIRVIEYIYMYGTYN